MKLLQQIISFLFKPKDKIYVNYIKNKEGLPKPLESEEEQKTIQLYMNHDEQARKKLIVHNLRLVVYIAKRYDVSASEMEDLISIGTIGLIKAVNTFKTDKNIKLVTYASRCIENEILMYLRKKSKSKKEISLDEPLNIDYDGNELLLGDIIGTENDLVEKTVEKNENKR
ncbi:MAG: sigma-70 family RNA polymerase sigma factor, partial [Traorella sp.]